MKTTMQAVLTASTLLVMLLLPASSFAGEIKGKVTGIRSLA